MRPPEEHASMLALELELGDDDDGKSNSEYITRKPVSPVTFRSHLIIVVVTTAVVSGILVHALDFLMASRMAFPKSMTKAKVEDEFSAVSPGREGGGETEGDSWSTTRSLLCPGGVPRHEEVGGALFELARDELGMIELPPTERDFVPNDGLNDNFFHFVGESTGYAAPEEGGGMIYLGIWKAAHDQINDYFLKSFDGVVTSSNIEELLHSIRRGRGPDSVNNVCVVTAIRDPVVHFLSGYNELETRNTGHAASLQNDVLYDRYQNGTTKRFEQFVADFVGHPKRTILGGIPHVYSMSGVLSVIAEMGLRLTSYLPSLHNLNNTWPEFLFNSCPFLPHSKRSQNMKLVEQQHESSLDPYGFRHAGERVWAQGGPTARALCAIHAMDYACWEQLPSGIPKLCWNVFTGAKFITKLKKKEVVK